jgi:HTH-type transcriptional regulator / antitoxin HigA
MIASATRLNIPRYSELLLRFTPKVIETKRENRLAIHALRALMAIENRNPEEEALLNLLGTLIDQFERKVYPTRRSEPRETLAWLLEENGMKPADLAEVMGGRSRVSDVLSGKRGISKEQAKRLAERFRVSAELFI